MAHFAKLNSSNIVTQVVVVNNDVLLENNVEVEQKGIDFLVSLFGQAVWKQTSYSGSIRKNYAGVGYKYDATRDAFIPPRPFNSWALNESTCTWEAPVAHPDGDGIYRWDEDTVQWVLTS